MTLDQKIQVFAVIGTWIASLSTVAAVIVALWLARRSDQVRLLVHVGLRVVAVGDGSPFKEHVTFSVTNIGDRPVTVNSVGWAIGRRKKRRYCIQPESGPYTAHYPIELAHGKSATFMVSFHHAPNWLSHFANDFVQDVSDRHLRSLVAQIHTSIGRTIEVRPEGDLLSRIKQSKSG